MTAEAQARLRPDEPWSLLRREIGQWRDSGPPFSARSVLVGAIGGAVDALPFMVGADAERFEQSMPSSLLGPSVKSVEHGLPRTELRGQISPRDTGSSPPEYGLDEPSIVAARSAGARFPLKDLANFLPLQIGELRSSRHPHVLSRSRSLREFLARLSAK